MLLFSARVAERETMVRAGYMPIVTEPANLCERRNVVSRVFSPARAAIAIRIITGWRSVGKDRAS